MARIHPLPLCPWSTEFNVYLRTATLLNGGSWSVVAMNRGSADMQLLFVRELQAWVLLALAMG